MPPPTLQCLLNCDNLSIDLNNIIHQLLKKHHVATGQDMKLNITIVMTSMLLGYTNFGKPNVRNIKQIFCCYLTLLPLKATKMR